MRGMRAAAKYRRSVKGLRYFSFPHRYGGSGERSEPIGALMPHAAIPFRPHHRFAIPLPRSRRGGLVTRRFLAESRNISFPRRCGGSGERSEPIGAPMPHAALFVLQPRGGIWLCLLTSGFNAARGFVGGAAEPEEHF